MLLFIIIIIFVFLPFELIMWLYLCNLKNFYICNAFTSYGYFVHSIWGQGFNQSEAVLPDFFFQYWGLNLGPLAC
jgi:hypothetical protein